MDAEEHAALGSLGPYFTVCRAIDTSSWRPVRDLLDPDVMGERVDHAHRLLRTMAGAAVEVRVAVSTLSLGLFARLVSPVLGATVLGIPLPQPSLDDAWWQPIPHGPWPLAMTGAPADPDLEDLLDEVVVPLAGTLAESFSLSEQVLRGNAASAVFGATAMVGSSRPDLWPAARELGMALLRGPLAGTGEVRSGFVRSSCCLYYRIPGGGYCSDCVLAHPLAKACRD